MNFFSQPAIRDFSRQFPQFLNGRRRIKLNFEKLKKKPRKMAASRKRMRLSDNLADLIGKEEASRREVMKVFLAIFPKIVQESSFSKSNIYQNS